MLEEGNVAPGQRFKPKKAKKLNDAGVTESEDSSDEEEVKEVEDEDVQDFSGPQMSFIQMMFDSQIKRKFEEN